MPAIRRAHAGDAGRLSEVAEATSRAAKRPGEIQRLYVVEDWHGKGVAQALMQACIEAMQRRGADVVWLGVWEHNPRAIAFYGKFGFVVAGEHVFSLGGDQQRDLVMVRAISSK